MKQRLEDRNEQRRQDFERLYEKERLRFDACLKRLAGKYFLSENSILHIVKGYKGYGE